MTSTTTGRAETARARWMLARPSIELDQATRSRFDQLADWTTSRAGGEQIAYDLEAPLWQFLCYLGDQGRVVFHGSGVGDITEFEPRQPVDLGCFGAQRGVFGTSDGIWSMFYAVLDRDRYRGIMINSCVLVGEPGRPGYYFSLDPQRVVGEPVGPADPGGQWPWRSGWVYLLPATTFTAETVDDEDGALVRSTQRRSTEPVRPLAKVAVTPDDFPFRSQVRAHDDTAVRACAAADPGGFPWLDALRSTARPSAAELLAQALGTRPSVARRDDIWSDEGTSAC